MQVRLLAVLVAATVVLGGCGDDKESTTAGVDTTVAGTRTTTTDNDGSGSEGPPGAITSAKCVQAAASMGRLASGLQTAFSGTAANLDTSIDELEAFASAAPAEIRSDFEKVAEGYAAVIKAFQDAGYDPTSGKPPSPEAAQKLEAASESLNDADLNAAGQRVSTWFAQKCGK